jgi:thiol-disulfide isomerase/thioredoxin
MVLVSSFLSICAIAQSDLHAKLVDKNGAPVVGAKVDYRFYDNAEKDPKSRFKMFTAKTEPDGSFTFQSFQASTLPITVAVQFPNGNMRRATIKSDGETAVVDDKSFALTVKIVDAKRQPVSGALVSIDQMIITSPNGRGFMISPGNKPVPTNVSGIAKILDIAADTAVYYKVDAKGYPALTDQTQNLKADESITVSVLHPVTLAGVVTRNGQPVQGAQVNATTFVYHDNGFFGKGASAQTGADGRYELTAAPGMIDLTATKGNDLCCVPLKGIHTAEGNDLDGLNLALIPKVNLTGKILEKESRAPVKGALVRLGGQEITTGADGVFKFAVQPGDFQIQVPKIGDQTLEWTDQIDVNGAVDEAHNPPITIFVPKATMLPPLQKIHGTVKDGNGKPVAGADVWIFTGDHATTDDAGHYEFLKPLNPGQKLFAVSKTATCAAMATLMDKDQVDFVLNTPASVLTGKIVDDAGTPVANAKVAAMGARDNFVFPYGSATTDASGTYTIDGVFSGMPGYMLQVSCNGYGGNQANDLSVKVGETLKVNDLMIGRADATLHGKVLEPDGKPAKSIPVQCTTAHNLVATTDEKGEFAMTGVPRGNVFLYVPSTGDEFGSASAKGGQQDVVIKLEKSQRNAGQIEQDMGGQKAGEIKFGEWLNGTKVSPADLKGKIVVLDMWAIWCHPCVMAMPQVQALYNKYKGQNVVVLGVHMLGTPFDKAKAFVDKKGFTYPLFMDYDGAVDYTNFPAKGIPQIYVIAPDGTITCDTHDVSEAADAVEALVKKRSK